MTSHSLAGGLLAAAIALAGCGGDEGGKCGDFAGCGGDVVGEWKAGTVCGGGTISTEACSTIPVELGDLTATGAITFNADRSYRSTLVFGGSMLMHWPKSCLTIQEMTLNCQQLNAAINLGLMQEPDPLISSVVCKDESQGCACKTTLSPVGGVERVGRYTTSGNTLTTTPDQAGSGPESSEYCVKGQSLELKFLPIDMLDDARGGITLKR